jgi:hypothetical protein
MTGRKAGFSTADNQTGLALKFERQFAHWIDQALSEKLPDNIEGFCFNLFEPARRGNADPRFAIELVGSSVFDKYDTDWPCEEIFEANPRSLSIPVNYYSDDWQTCLSRMKIIIAEFLSKPSRSAQILNAARGVGIGFVNGDLAIIRSGVNNAS